MVAYSSLQKRRLDIPMEQKFFFHLYNQVPNFTSIPKRLWEENFR